MKFYQKHNSPDDIVGEILFEELKVVRHILKLSQN